MGFGNEPARTFAPRVGELSIEDIKSKITIPDLWTKFGYQGDPTKRGLLISPFRAERTPSFDITEQGTRFKDWGSAEIGGDIFDFYQRAAGCSKADAIRDLKAMCGDPGIQSRPALRVDREPREEFPGYPTDEIAELIHTAPFAYPENPGPVTKSLFSRKKWEWERLCALAEEGCIGTFPDFTFTTRKGLKVNLRDRLAYIYPHGIKCRPLAETSHKDFWVWGKMLHNIWRGERLSDPAVTTVLLFEGETDLISLYCLMGEPPRIAMVAAAGANWCPSPKMAHLLGSHRKVILCCDDDPAGRVLEARVGEALKNHATYCTVVKFPWRELCATDGDDIGKCCVEKPKELLNILDKLLV